MKKILIALVSAGFLATAFLVAGPGLFGQAAPSNSADEPIEHVIIVSVDGLMPTSYLHPDEHGLKIPMLREIVREGAYSAGARSVFPTLTYPSHTAMVTGTNPGTHGVVSNLAWDPLGKNQGGWRWYTPDIRVPTIWQLAQTRGLRTALVSWPVTVGAEANAVVPEFWRAGTPDDVKLMEALSTPRGILDEVSVRFPDFRAGYTPPDTQDQALADIAVYLIKTLRPNLLLLHIIQVDHWQHREGLFSPEAKAAIENADHQIVRLMEAAKEAGTWNRTALVVVSDHGFAAISKSVRPGVLLRKKGLITLDKKGHIADWKACLVADGGTAYLYVKDKDDRRTREQLRKIFLPLEGQRDSGIRRVFTQKQIAQFGGDPNAFLALEAADGFGMAAGYLDPYLSPSPILATHGYPPDRAEMLASLLVYGPSIGAGKIENARLIDVAPTVAGWLGLKLEKAEGSPLQIPRHGAAE